MAAVELATIVGIAVMAVKGAKLLDAAGELLVDRASGLVDGEIGKLLSPVDRMRAFRQTRQDIGPDRLKNHDIDRVIGATLAACAWQILDEQGGGISGDANDAFRRHWLKQAKETLLKAWLAAMDGHGAAIPERFKSLEGAAWHRHFQNGSEEFLSKPVASKEEWVQLLENLIPVSGDRGKDSARKAAFGEMAERLEPNFLRWSGYVIRRQPAAFRGVVLYALSDLTDLVNKQPLLEDFSDRPKATDESRFIFEYQAHEFIGRQDERDTLWEWARTGGRLAAWGLTGRAGAGKSRLALELCIDLQADGWNAGFHKPEWELKDWTSWRPELPTLIVLDYGLLRPVLKEPREQDPARQIGEWLQALHGASSRWAHNVRVLILDRDADSPRWRTMADNRSDLMAPICGPHWQGGQLVPLDLPPLGAKQLELLVKSEFDRAGAEPKAEELQGLLDFLATEDAAGRPLFAVLGAYAAIQDAAPDDWTEKSILAAVLNLEYRKWQAEGIQRDWLNALLFACLSGPWWKTGDFAECLPQEDILEERERLLNSWSSSSGAEDCLHPLLPDALAEAFILEAISGKLNQFPSIANGRGASAGQARAEAAEIVCAAWRLRPEATSQTVTRMARDLWDDDRLDVLLDRERCGLDDQPGLERTPWAVAAGTALLQCAVFVGFRHRRWAQINRGVAWAEAAAMALYSLSRVQARAQVAKRRLRDLRRVHPEDSVIRKWLAKVLNGAVFDCSTNPACADSYLFELRDIAAAHPQDAEVREWLARGLSNAVYGSSSDPARVDGLLGELRELSVAHPQDAEVREWLAQGLSIAVYRSSSDPTRVDGLLGELRVFAAAHPEDAAVRKELAKGLFNAVYGSSSDPARLDGLLVELRVFAAAHPEDAAVRKELAQGLVNAVARSSSDPTRADGLLGELRDLSVAHPQDAAVQEMLAKGLYNAINDSSSDPARVGGLLVELRDLWVAHPQIAAVREELAKGLNNAVAHSSSYLVGAGSLLGELRDLSVAHPQDAAVRENLAMGLFNAVNDSSSDPDRVDGLLGELRALAAAHPQDSTVREWLANGLFNAFLDSSSDSARANGRLAELINLAAQNPENAGVNAVAAYGLLSHAVDWQTVAPNLAIIEPFLLRAGLHPNAQPAWDWLIQANNLTPALAAKLEELHREAQP